MLPLLPPLGRLLLLLRRGLPLRGLGLRLLALLRLRLRQRPTLHARLVLRCKPGILLPGLLRVLLLLRLQLSHLLLHVVLRLLLRRRWLRWCLTLLLLLCERVLLCLLGHSVRLRLRLRSILLLGLRLLVIPLTRALLLPLVAGRILNLLILDPVRRLGLRRGPVLGLLRRRGVGRRVRRRAIHRRRRPQLALRLHVLRLLETRSQSGLLARVCALLLGPLLPTPLWRAAFEVLQALGPNPTQTPSDSDLATWFLTGWCPGLGSIPLYAGHMSRWQSSYLYCAILLRDSRGRGCCGVCCSVRCLHRRLMLLLMYALQHTPDHVA